MTGHLQIKSNKYYAVINTYRDGKRIQKWINSGLEIKGNKRCAEQFLRKQICLLEQKEAVVYSDILFSEYVKIWLNVISKSVDEITLQGYEQLAYGHIIPYFESKKIKLQVS